MSRVSDECVEDLAVYCIQVCKALLKKGMSEGQITYIIALMCFQQFNGTRNDDEAIFKKIVANLEKHIGDGLKEDK